MKNICLLKITRLHFDKKLLSLWHNLGIYTISEQVANPLRQWLRVNNTKLFTEALKLKENLIYTHDQNEKKYIIILQTIT